MKGVSIWCVFPHVTSKAKSPRDGSVYPFCFFVFFLFFGNPRSIGSRVYSALCLWPGAQCWQGRQAWEASSRVGASQEKPPGLRRWQEGGPGSCPWSLASELPGTGLAWRQQLWLRPFAESQGHKTEPSFQSDTKWSLHRASPPSPSIWTHTAHVLMQERGLEKHEVQPPSRARMLGLDRMKQNATRV